MKNKKLIIGIAIAVVVAIIATVAVVLVVTGDDDKDSRKKKKSDKETVEQEAPQVDSGKVVATYGDYEITEGEYSYFYMSLYNQVVSIAEQYDQYYPGYGSQYFDVTVDPAAQQCKEASLPEGVVTWADYFAYCAPERAVLVKTLYNNAIDAEKDGFKLTAEEKASLQTNIDETIEVYKEHANDLDITLDEYLEQSFGEYVTEALFRELLEKEYVAELYLAWYQETATENVKDADVEAYYNEHKAELDVTTIRVFGISYAEVKEGSEDPQYTKEEAKALADEFAAKIAEGGVFKELALEYAVPSVKESYEDDSATLMNYQTKVALESIYTGLGEWAFSADTKVNDTKIIDLEARNAYFVIMLERVAEKNVTPTSVAVRHILIEVPKTMLTDDGSTVALPAETIEMNKQNAFAKAQEVVSLWQKNGATEQAFIDLVSLYTNDPGSLSNGGLYDGINYTSSYVTEFLDWSLAPHNEGDVEIIQTTYGYHVMYYVGGDTTPVWLTDVRSQLSTEQFEEYYTGLTANIRDGVEFSEEDIDELREKIEKIVKNKTLEYQSYYSW